MISKKAEDGGSNPPRAMVGMERTHYKNTTINIMRIVKILKDASTESEGYITVSEIARRGGMHKWTVSRTLDLYMRSLVDVVQPEELEAIGLQAKLVRLKNPNITPQQVVGYLKMRKNISL